MINVSKRPVVSREKAVITLIAALFVAGAGYKLVGLANYRYYAFMFQPLPEVVIELRYTASIVLRMVTLVMAVGLMRRVEFYRRLAVGLVVLNFLALFWKHPYRVFFNIAVLAERGYPDLFPVVTGHEALAYPYFPWISLVFHTFIDVAFGSFVLYAFTRPSIKKEFR